MFEIIFLYILLAPLIGNIIFYILWVIRMLILMADVSMIEGVFGYLLISPLFGMFAYPHAIIVSLIPSSLSGVIYWVILRYFTTENISIKNRIIIGGSIGFVISTVYVLFYITTKESYLLTLTFWIISGTLAISTCSLCVTDRKYKKYLCT